MINKRGEGVPKFVIFTGVGIMIFIGFLILFSIFVGTGSPVWNSITNAAAVSIDATGESFANVLGSSFVFMDYVFGQIPSLLLGFTNNPYSSVIITLAVWGLLFVTFGDIIATFGTFNRNIAWLAAFFITIIAANLKFVIFVTAVMVGIFSFLGGLAVFVGIGTAFAAFILVNLGIRKAGGWIMNRRILNEAATRSLKSEAGGRELAGTIKGLKEAGEALRG